LLARKAKRALRQKNLVALEKSLRPMNVRSDRERIHVLGPYRNRDKWRVVLVDGKERKSVCVSSQEEALALIAKCRQETERISSQTIEASLQSYRTHLLGARHVLPSTAEHVLTSLAGWLPLSALVSSLTPAKAQRLYEELTRRISERTGKVLAVATHQFFLSCAKGWGKWAHRERLVGANPFADVAVVGKKHNGKMQLRIDEARQLADSTQELADAGDSDALAILLMLHLGLRQGEVGARVARDVDAQGRLLWITAGKTENATRRLEVPECLRAPLLALASRKQPGELLFADGPTVPSRQHFWGKLRLFCRRAQVPLVCPHSLRGLHATLAIEAGATGGMVAHALGHGSFQVTARHYATAESIAGSRAARVSEALGTKDDAVSRLLAELSPAQLEDLKKRLG
jgi:integrase